MRHSMMKLLLPHLPLAASIAAAAQAMTTPPDASARLVVWRRDFRQHSELGEHETRTAQVIAEQLRAFACKHARAAAASA